MDVNLKMLSFSDRAGYWSVRKCIKKIVCNQEMPVRQQFDKLMGKRHDASNGLYSLPNTTYLMS